MRRILYNQGYFSNDKLIEELYEVFLKNEGSEHDVYEAVEFSLSHFKSDLFFPSREKLKEEYPNFEFIEMPFSTEVDCNIFIKEKSKFFRDNLRKTLCIKLMNDDLDIKKRLEILDQLTRMDISLYANEETVTDSKKLNIKELYSRRKNKSSGILTNIPEVDELTGGISSGKIVGIIAPSKAGKTTQLINMCTMNVRIPDNNSMFLSLEIPKDELWYKTLMRHSYDSKHNIDSVLSILKGKLKEDEEEILYELDTAFRQAMKSELLLMDSTDLKLESLSMFKAQLEDLIVKNNLKTIYLDYLQLFKAFKPKNYKDIYEWQNDVVGMLRVVGVEKDCRMIIASQVSKESEKREVKSGEGNFEATDVSEANALQRDCYYMISMFENAALKSANQTKVKLILHRDGETFSEPKITNMNHKKFIVGDINFSITEATHVKEDNTVKEDGIEMIDLFS